MYKKIILVICLLFTTQAVAKKQALLVGVSDYGGNPRNDLIGINLDIDKMREVFQSRGFEVKILRDSESLQIDSYLNSYSGLSSDDTFVFYYSGHGSFVPDKNQDEHDGRDEALVLSDGVRNIPYIDDKLNYYLNNIRAKKLIIFDACHSGTAHRGGNGQTMAKTLPVAELSAMVSKGIKVGGADLSGKYMVLSASRDSEESIATAGGSLFTNELYKMLRHKSSTPLESMREEMTYNIVNRCRQVQEKPHHPQFSFSDASFKNISIDGYLKTITRPQTQPIQSSNLQLKLDRMVMSAGANQIAIGNKRSSYNTNDFVTFTLNTNGQRGYLTILYVDTNDVTVLYPNPRVTSVPISGEKRFPEDFGNFKIRAFKGCGNCQQEKTNIYLLLTPQPLENIERMSRDKLLSFAKGSSREQIVSKAVEVVDEPMKSQSSGFLMGKYEFWVK